MYFAGRWWGGLAWAVLGSLTAILLAYAHYGQGKPLQPRTLLHPVFGDWILTSWLGGVAMAVMAGVLLYMGAGQIGVLQQFIVISAIPVSLIILPSLWAGPQAAFAMAREQQIIN